MRKCAADLGKKAKPKKHYGRRLGEKKASVSALIVIMVALGIKKATKEMIAFILFLLGL